MKRRPPGADPGFGSHSRPAESAAKQARFAIVAALFRSIRFFIGTNLEESLRRVLVALVSGCLILVFSVNLAHAGISQVGTGSMVGGATATTVVLTKPTGLVVGDVILVQVAARGGTGVTITAPATTSPDTTWILISRLNSGTAFAQAIYYKIATATDVAATSYTFSFAPGVYHSAGIVAYRGVDPSSPINASSGQVNASATTVTAPSITTTVPNTQLVGFFGISNTATLTPPATLVSKFAGTSGGGNNGSSLLGADQTLAASGATGTRIATASNKDVNIGHLVALKPGRTFLIQAAGGGNIATQVAGTSFNIKITAQLPDGTTDTGFTGTVTLTSTGSLSVGSGTTAAFTAGVLSSHTVRISNTGDFILTATDATSNTGTSTSFLVVSKLQILVPGETAAPGTSSGKTGTPSTQNAGVAFNVTVNAVDENWNLVTTAADTVTLTSSDPAAVLPAAAALVNGTQTFSVTLNTAPSQTVTANATSPTRTNTSPSIPLVATVSSFNVVEAGANAVSGKIFTKIAGQDIVVDIVALDASNNLATGFTGDVSVDLVDNSGGGACSSLPLIKALTNQTFVAGDSGRHPLSSGQFEANAYRNVKFRIKYPTTSPTVTSCSADAFANRPKQFTNLLVRDANRTTAGTTNTLNNTSSPGTGVVHNAGQAFRIDATAQNGAGSPATTTLYSPDSGQPVAVVSQCGVAAVCPASVGAVTTTAAYTSSSGVITNTTASYNDIGAFNVALEDRTFSAVDAADGTTTSVRYIPSSAAVTVGRFVPDYFSLEAGSTLTPRSDIGACSGSTFTYMGERMTLGFTLKARDSAGNVLANYAGSTLGALVITNSASYGFGAIDSTVPTLLTSRLDLSLVSGATGAWASGVANIAVPLALSRAASPDGPYSSFKIGIAPSDPDGVALQTGALNLDADNSGSPERAQVGPVTALRFGRLRLTSAYGSDLLPLRVPVRAEFYSNSAWMLNTADSCTPVAANTLQIGSVVQQSGSSLAFGTPPAGISVVAISGGRGSISVTPSTKGAGIADIRLNLGGGVGTTGCSTLGSPLGGTAPASALDYLAGNWCGNNHDRAPSARIRFGSPTAPFIFLRERH